MDLTLMASFHEDAGLFELDDAILEEADLLCNYASKKCTNVRTTKKGGGLHRFCEFHRRRANQNQWRVDNKRRAIRAERRQTLRRARASSATAAEIDLEPQADQASLTEDDIHVLHAMLFDNENENLSVAALGDTDVDDTSFRIVYLA